MTHPAVLKLERVRVAMMESLARAVDEYANGGRAGKPAVSAHFTPGNRQRYGWAPLSRAYELRKAGSIVMHKGLAFSLGSDARSEVRAMRAKHREGMSKWRGMRGDDHLDRASLKRARREQRAANRDELRSLLGKLTAGRQGSRLDRSDGGMSDRTLFGASARSNVANLPVLVLTGALRAAVNSRTHLVRILGNRVVVSFRNLPKYAKWHHTGTARMPARSPVAPNAADVAGIVRAAQRFMANRIRARMRPAGGGAAAAPSAA